MIRFFPKPLCTFKKLNWTAETLELFLNHLIFLNNPIIVFNLNSIRRESAPLSRFTNIVRFISKDLIDWLIDWIVVHVQTKILAMKAFLS